MVEARLAGAASVAMAEEIEAAVSLLGSYAGFPPASTTMGILVEKLGRLGHPLDGG